MPITVVYKQVHPDPIFIPSIGLALPLSPSPALNPTLSSTNMGSAAMPADIITEPDKKIVYNAPFSEKNVYNVRLTNNGAHRWSTAYSLHFDYSQRQRSVQYDCKGSQLSVRCVQ